MPDLPKPAEVSVLFFQTVFIMMLGDDLYLRREIGPAKLGEDHRGVIAAVRGVEEDDLKGPFDEPEDQVLRRAMVDFGPVDRFKQIEVFPKRPDQSHFLFDENDFLGPPAEGFNADQADSGV